MQAEMRLKTKYFYIMGSESGIGKSMLCEGLLSQLLTHGYRPEQLAYIKPMTQCTDKQPVTEFCERNQIPHRSLGTLVFNQGFTKNFIDGMTKNSVELMDDVLAAISHISKEKEIVIIDGIGNPATGSVVGVSNVDIARSISAPVLFVGRAGIGSSIDDTILKVSYIQQQGIHNIALIYNKIQPAHRESVKHCLSKRLAELLPNVPVLDFIDMQQKLDIQTKHASAAAIYRWFALINDN